MAVTAVEAVSPAMIVAQVRAVVEDIGVDAVKVGMLGSVASARAVGEAFDLLAPGTPIVVDPVMVAESGARLLDEDAQAALVELVVAARHGRDARTSPRRGCSPATTRSTARSWRGRSTRSGRGRSWSPAGTASRRSTSSSTASAWSSSPGRATPTAPRTARAARTPSTLAARLALGDDLEAAAREAKRVASEAVRDGLRAIGAGAGPVDVLGLARRAAERARDPALGGWVVGRRTPFDEAGGQTPALCHNRRSP